MYEFACLGDYLLGSSYDRLELSQVFGEVWLAGFPLPVTIMSMKAPILWAICS